MRVALRILLVLRVGGSFGPAGVPATPADHCLAAAHRILEIEACSADAPDAMITILQWIRRSFGSQGERLGLAKESIKGLGAGAYLIDVLPSAVLSLGVLALF